MNTTKNTPTIRDGHLSPQEKIGQAVRWVGKHEPIAVPTILTRWAIEPTCTVPTMATDGKRIRFNPDFVATLSLSATRAIVLHEVGHILSQHHHRRSGRDTTGWNIACDLALNCLLQRGYNAAFDGSGAGLYNELIDTASPSAGCFAGFGKFSHVPANLTAEEYYDLLKGELEQEQEQEQGTGDKPGSGDTESSADDTDQQGGDTESSADDTDSIDTDQQGGDTDSSDTESSGTGTGTGTGSPFADKFGDPTQTFGGGIEDSPADEEGDDGRREDEQSLILETLLNHEAVDNFSPLGLGKILSGVRERLLGDPEAAASVNWRALLEEFLSSAHRGSPSYSKPNRRLHALGSSLGIVFQSKSGKSATNGAVVVDTSGSMGDEDCGQALSHVGGILQAYPSSTVNMIQCDTGVRCSDEYTGGDFPPKDWKGWAGRGGTDLNPALQFIRDRRDEFDWCVVVTDGEFARHGLTDPGIPVMWVQTRDCSWWTKSGYPFGRVVNMHAIK